MGNKSRYTANLVSDNNLFVDITNDRVGVGSIYPTAKLDVDGTLNVSGICTATSFSGIGSNLTGLTGASAGTYGNATNSAQITVDANGRITGISQIGISTSGGGGISGVNIFDSGTSVGLTTNLEFRNNVTAVSSGSTTIVDVGNNGLNVSGMCSFTGLTTITGDLYASGIVTASYFYTSGSPNLQIGYPVDTINSGPNAQIHFDTFSGHLQFGAAGTSTGRGNFIFYKKRGLGDKVALVTIYSDTGNMYVAGTLSVPNGTTAPLHYFSDNSKKLETTGYGVTVYGGVNVSGVSTFNDNLELSGANIVLGLSASANDDRIKFSTSEIYQDTGAALKIVGNVDGIALRGGGTNSWSNVAGNEDYIVAVENAGVSLYHNNSKKFETTASGINVIGHTETDTLNVSGICTAASFSGNGNDIVHSTWTLGANGSSHYTFTGPGGLSNTDDPKIYLARGQTYEFVNNSGGSHPFQIQQSNGSAYSTGVTNNGASSGTIRFEVPFSAPNTLQYKCTSHSSMGNTIIVYPDISP